MDQIKKTNNKKRKAMFRALFVILMILVAYYYIRLDTNIVVDRQQLLLGTVKQGELKLDVQAPGKLVDNDVRWVTSQVSGRVEKIKVKAGTYVKKGDVLVQLTNLKLQQRIDELKWEIESMKAQNLANKTELESAFLDQQANVLQARSQYEIARLKQDREEELVAEGKYLLSPINYKQSKLVVSQLYQKWQIEVNRKNKMKENHKAQKLANDAKLHRLINQLTQAQNQKNDLIVTAPNNGIIQSIVVELGQQLSAGSNLLKQAGQGHIIAQLDIPQINIYNIALEQEVTISLGQKKLNGKVIRIDPTVSKGIIKVDITLQSRLPKEARPEQTIYGSIEIAHLKNTLYVDKPRFISEQQLASVYKLSTDNHLATRVPVQFGTGSGNKITVKSGLSVGDQIILSDTGNWNNAAQIEIN